MDSSGRLIVVCGLPGSGKTTVARRLATDHSAVRLCPDEWMDRLGINLWDSDARGRIESLQWGLARQVIEAGGTAVIEWGTWARAERDMLRTGARELGAAVELVYLDVEIDELWLRIERRGREDPPIRRDELEGWAATFEQPTPDELALFDPPMDSPRQRS